MPHGNSLWMLSAIISKATMRRNARNFQDTDRLILPSPCSSVNLNACTRRIVSSTERPTGRSFTVICLRIPLLSMIKSPLKKQRVSCCRLNSGFTVYQEGQNETSEEEVRFILHVGQKDAVSICTDGTGPRLFETRIVILGLRWHFGHRKWDWNERIRIRCQK